MGGVNSASAASSSPVFAVNDDATGEDTNSGLPKTFGNTGDANTATISKSEDGKTLTIRGKGNLTKIGAAYKFASTLPKNTVFQKGTDDNTHTAVSENAAYTSSNTYETREATYTQIENFANTYTEKKTHYYFTQAGAETYYTKSQVWDGTQNANVDTYTAVSAGDEVDTNNSAWVVNETGTGTKYFTRSGDEGSYTYARVKESSTITSSTTNTTSQELQHLKLGDQNGSIFYLSDGKYVAATNDVQYNENTSYHMRSWTYTTITEEQLIANNYLTNESELIKFLWTTNTYETVKFENESTDAPLYIDGDIVKAILYYQTGNDSYTWHAVNSSIKTLDLGAATITNLSSATFSNDWSANGTSALAQITLPLTAKSGEGEKEMVLPAQVLKQFGGSTSIVTTVIVPEGYTKLAANAFGGESSKYTAMNAMANITLPTTLTEIGDSAFMYCGKLQDAGLGKATSLKTIGVRAFWSADLRSVEFPPTLDKIDDAAFMDQKHLTNLKFPAGLRYIGRSAFAWTNNTDETTQKALVLTTLEIPASVKYIGPGAFNWHEYQDVYFLGEDAPVMPMGTDASGNANQVAFSYHIYMINNGMQSAASEGTLRENTSTGWANRVNYQGTGGQYACIIHYPKNLSTDKANKYQDQTRVYKTITPYDANSTYKPNESEPAENYKKMTEYGQISITSNEPNYGYKDTYLGEQYIWPSMTQVQRAYIYNSNGYNWDGTTVYEPELTQAEKEVLIEAGFLTATSTDDEIKAAQKYAHLGTRMFVLGMADANQDSEPDKEPEYPLSIKSGGKWWTLCVPFNMTKAQVKEVFGTSEKEPHVCRFNAVDRTEQGSYKKVTLHFQKDVYVHKFTKDDQGNYTDANTTTSDDDIVIYAHEAYMIYPTRELNDGEKYTVKNYEYVEGSPNPTIVQANTHNTNYTGQDKKEYRFIGNYVGNTTAASDVDASTGDQTKAAASVYVPQYSYMYAKKKSDNDYKFWFWAGETANGIVWNPNTCVVQATAKDGGANEYSDIFGGNQNATSDGAKQVSIFGDAEDEATGIDSVTIIAGEGADAQVVYNLNGQPVSNGSLNGLARGIYIQNGKKFVVK